MPPDHFIQAGYPSRRGRFSLRTVVRMGLAMFLFLLIYDGALRKWAFPGAEQILFILKDALLAVLLVLVLTGQQWKSGWALPRTVGYLLLLYAFWVLLEATNFNLPGLFVSVWGVKAHLLYASLIVLLPFAFFTVEEFIAFLAKIYPYLVIPVCCVAMLQLVSPDTSFINKAINDAGAGTAYFGEVALVRVTGTFSYITGMASFVQAAGLLGLGLFVLGVRSPSFLIGLAFAFALLPGTGSRSVVVVMTVAAMILFSSAYVARQITLSRLLVTAFIGAVLFAASFYWQDKAWLALQQRSLSANHDHNRMFTVFTNAFEHAGVAGLFGFGSGSANYGSVALAGNVIPFSWLPMGSRFEEETGRIVIELGIIGWALSLLMRMAFVFWACALLLRGRSKAVRSIAVIAMPVVFLGLYQGNGVFAPPMWASYYWFCIAMMAMAQYENRKLRAGAHYHSGRLLTDR